MLSLARAGGVLQRGVWLLFLCCWSATPAAAAELQLEPVRVAPGTYVVYGSLDRPGYDNDALNVNLGFVVTSAGIAVIDSGPSYRVAQSLHRAIQRISSYPIKYVINTGADPARWLGNGYFKKLGVPLLAHQEARKLMEARGPDQLKAMQALLQEKAAGTELALPRGFAGDSQEVRFSDSVIQLSYFGVAQRPGDIAVWLPRQEIAFTGAIMQADALPELTADSSLAGWIVAFDSIASLRPRQTVPGRGKVGDVALMSGDTLAYLMALRTVISQPGASLGDFLADALNAKELASFKRLRQDKELASKNVLHGLREKGAAK